MALKILSLMLLLGCATGVTNALPKRLVVPEDMRASPPPAPPPPPATVPVQPAKVTAQGTVATPVVMRPAAPPAQPSPPKRYVVRLTEHGRTWELELPEARGGYEVRIPIEPMPGEQPSAADAEMLAGATAPKKGYLANLARIAEMYSAHKYEMALIELVDLESSFPKDGRIQAMKGSLYQKLGKAKLARDSWQKALALDPTDSGVVEALRELQAKEE
jgi:hypothetical protein